MNTEINSIVAPLEKRRYERVFHAARDARLTFGRGLFRRSLKGVVRNVSLTGISVEVPKSSIQDGDPITLHWRVPTEINRKRRARKYALSGKVIRTEFVRPDAVHVGVRFDGLITEQIENIEAHLDKTLIALLIMALIAAICFLKIKNVTTFWYEPLFQGYSIAAAAFILSRVALSYFYREPEDVGYMPSISIIIAARNEETNIAETIHKCFSSRYPSDLFDVIAVDDGSTDNTWRAMDNLTAVYPRLRTFRFEKNLGKRHGMALGAQKALGKILVYVDSDSYLDPEGLYRIVQAFADPRVGAVAGHTMVRVQPKNFISKMESVRYYISHQVIKTAESIFGVVTCCPGAFSAYRRDLVINVLPKWLNQRFLGTAATFGDDRSLTNYILRTHRVLFHSSARALTDVPDRWMKFFRQQLRWKKSWMRETTIASRIMLRKHPIAAFFYYLGVIVTLLSPLMMLRALVYIPYVMAGTCLPYLTGLFLVYLLLCLIFFYKTRKSYWYCGLGFAVLYVVFFSLQNYYAMLTVSRNHWGTR